MYVIFIVSVLKLTTHLSYCVTSGSTETARLRPAARTSQTDLMSVNGDVPMTTVADGDITNRDQSVYGSSSHQSWRRIVLLIIAITVHNIPGEEM